MILSGIVEKSYVLWYWGEQDKRNTGVNKTKETLLRGMSQGYVWDAQTGNATKD